MGDAQANTLGKQELPILGAQRGGEYTHRQEDRTRQEDGPEVASISKAAGKSAHKEEQKDIDRADP